MIQGAAQVWGQQYGDRRRQLAVFSLHHLIASLSEYHSFGNRYVEKLPNLTSGLGPGRNSFDCSDIVTSYSQIR